MKKKKKKEARCLSVVLSVIMVCMLGIQTLNVYAYEQKDRIQPAEENEQVEYSRLGGYFRAQGTYEEFDEICDEKFIIPDLSEDGIENENSTELVGGFYRLSRSAVRSTEFYVDQLPTMEHRKWWIEMDAVCREYLERNENLVKSTAFVAAPDSTVLPYMDMVNLFRFSNPQYFFLSASYRYTKKDGKYFIAINVYDAFLDGCERQNASNDFEERISCYTEECLALQNSYMETLGMDDLNAKLRAIHDTICLNTTYNDNAMRSSYDTKKDRDFTQSAFSVFCKNSTLCAGYTMAFVLLCNQVDMPCIGVFGSSNGGAHAWNKVAVDEVWYNMDLTWDDEAYQEIGYDYYARSDSHFYGHSSEKSIAGYLPGCCYDSTSSISKCGVLTVENRPHQMKKVEKQSATKTTDGIKSYYLCELCRRKYTDESGRIKVQYKNLIIPPITENIPENGWWIDKDGQKYWYENGTRQGYLPNQPNYRGKEIYDPESDAWYWLDNVQNGAMATDKDVFQESAAGIWGDNIVLYTDGTIDPNNTTGKWVHYDANGHMQKGWSEDKMYYYDLVYGTMVKGYATIEGIEYFFDPVTGVLEKEIGPVVEYGWAQNEGIWNWYEGWQRAGYSHQKDLYRGKEIYDPESVAWYWLDNISDGGITVKKDVYMNSPAGLYAENKVYLADGTLDIEHSFGKWVRYDTNGQMVKGWDITPLGTWYFDLVYGTMAKGKVVIESKEYEFDIVTGALKVE